MQKESRCFNLPLRSLGRCLRLDFDYISYFARKGLGRPRKSSLMATAASTAPAVNLSTPALSLPPSTSYALQPYPHNQPPPPAPTPRPPAPSISPHRLSLHDVVARLAANVSAVFIFAITVAGIAVMLWTKQSLDASRKALELAQWTARKDFFEFCKAQLVLSSQCISNMVGDIEPPPVLKRLLDPKTMMRWNGTGLVNLQTGYGQDLDESLYQFFLQTVFVTFCCLVIAAMVIPKLRRRRNCIACTEDILRRYFENDTLVNLYYPYIGQRLCFCTGRRHNERDSCFRALYPMVIQGDALNVQTPGNLPSTDTASASSSSYSGLIHL